MTVFFTEPLHHVCLMHGLKQTFGRMPFLNRKVLKIGGKVRTLDNYVAPPPMITSPKRMFRKRTLRHLVEVSYWKETLLIEFYEGLCSPQDISSFAEFLIQDYLHFRHPFMKTSSADGKITEASSGHLIAEIRNEEDTVSL